jgi:hypothetical protein
MSRPIIMLTAAMLALTSGKRIKHGCPFRR